MDTLVQMASCDGKAHKFSEHPKFASFYESHFAPVRGKVRRVLEIGIYMGKSVRLWRDYFPSATIYGIDFSEECMIRGEPRIVTGMCDQGDWGHLGAFLKEHGGDFDIIIDDGSHKWAHQKVSLLALFPALVPGGLYIVEDLHTSWKSCYGSRVGQPTYETLVNELHATGKKGRWPNGVTRGRVDTFRESVEGMTLYGKSGHLTSVLRKVGDEKKCPGSA